MTGRSPAAVCARCSASRSFGPVTLAERRALTPITTSRLREMAPRARSTLARFRSCSSPPGATPVRASYLRRFSRDGRDCVDVVGSARTGIDPPGDAVPQAHGWTFLAAPRVGVDVDEPGGDDLVTGIDRFGRIARD